MKPALARSTLAALALLLSVPAAAAEPPATPAVVPDTAFVRQVNAFVDGWHDDAAHTRPAYFDKIAPQGVYIGTDKSEIWTRDQFKAWARPFWERKKAWAFTAQKRNVYYSPDRRYVWFDEQLSTQMGTCQASGVLRNTGDGFLVEHYQLSLAVPNALNAGFAKAIADYESKAPR